MSTSRAMSYHFSVQHGCHQTGGSACLLRALGRPYPRVQAPISTQACQPRRACVASQSGKGGGARPNLPLAGSGPLALSPRAAHTRTGDALAALDAADALDPDLPELWTARCRVLKHAGDLAGAAAAAVRAQDMDLADRCAPGRALRGCRRVFRALEQPVGAIDTNYVAAAELPAPTHV